MFKRLSCALISLGMVVALGGPALAAEETGTIRVTLQNGETLVPDGSVVLYHAGTPIDGDYRLTEEFGGGVIREEDALSPSLARWLSEMAGDSGWEMALDNFGSAEFGELSEGLYLVTQGQTSTGYHPMEPILVEIPCQFQWHVQTFPITQEIVYDLPPTGQSPLPLLGAVGMILSGTGLFVCTYCNRSARRRRA